VPSGQTVRFSVRMGPGKQTRLRSGHQQAQCVTWCVSAEPDDILIPNRRYDVTADSIEGVGSAGWAISPKVAHVPDYVA